MSRTVAALAALCLSATLVGCSEDEPALDPAAPSESVAPEASEPGEPSEPDTAAADQPFELVQDDGTWAVGHGIRFRVPEEWLAYGEEFLGRAGDTYE